MIVPRVKEKAYVSNNLPHYLSNGIKQNVIIDNMIGIKHISGVPSINTIEQETPSETLRSK